MENLPERSSPSFNDTMVQGHKMSDYLSLAKSGKNQWWRYLLAAIFVILSSQFLGLIPSLLYVELAEQGSLSSEEFEFYKSDLDFEALGLSNNLGLLCLILSFAIGLLALWVSLRWIHKRPFLLLVNGFKKFRWNRIWFSVLIWGAISILHFLLGALISDDVIYLQFEWQSFLPLLIICVIFLPLQTSFEEFLFRGYYMQGIALLTKYPAIPILLTSALFALAHMFNPEVAAFGWEVMFVYYFCFGVCMAIVTVMDKGIELALGMHAIHNIISALTVTYEDAVIQTDAIWLAEKVEFGWQELLGFVVMFFFFLYFCHLRFEDV